MCLRRVISIIVGDFEDKMTDFPGDGNRPDQDIRLPDEVCSYLKNSVWMFNRQEPNDVRTVSHFNLESQRFHGDLQFFTIACMMYGCLRL